MAVPKKAPNSLNRSHNPFLHLQTDIVTSIVTIRFSETSILVIVFIKRKSWWEGFMDAYFIRYANVPPPFVGSRLMRQWYFLVASVMYGIALRSFLFPSSVQDLIAHFVYEGVQVSPHLCHSRNDIGHLLFGCCSTKSGGGCWNFHQIAEVSAALTRWQLSGFDLVDFLYIFNYITFAEL